jgi:hydrogenase maturation protease
MSAEGAMSAESGLGVDSSEVEAAVDRMEARMVSPERQKQILVAGVGNAFLSDDGFGGAVAEGLTKREVPAGVTVMDFGTGGLDLAYEVMRGYDALVIIDVSRQGGEPGTLYVMEPDEAEFGGAIEDGEVLNPHGMDPKTMLRFVKSVGGWPGKVVIVACEPAGVEAMGMELSEDVAAAVERAVDTVLEQIAELQSNAAYEG